MTAGALDPSASQEWIELGRKVFEHASRAMIAYLDNYAIPFAAFMPHFLRVSAWFFCLFVCMRSVH